MEQYLMTLDDAVKQLKEFCKDGRGCRPKSYENFYCGVTNDLDRRAEEHNATFLGHLKAQSAKAALVLEARMHEEGFCTGKQLGNAAEDSVYVYVYKKGAKTIE
jgi:hypothetical protein